MDIRNSDNGCLRGRATAARRAGASASRGQSAIDPAPPSAGCLKAQAATEMLTLVAFAFVFIVPIAFLLFSATGNELSKTSVAQAKVSARTIADEAGEVYLQGEHAKRSVAVNFPSGVVNASIENGLVIIRLEQDGRMVDVVASTFANISGELPGRRAGNLQKINLEYIKNGSFVNITYG